MAFTLSQFSSELRQRNISRPNQYYVEILMPDAMTDAKVTDSRLVSMWCSSAHTPHTYMLTNDNFVEAGVRRKYAYDVDFQNLVLNFYIDQDYQVKQFFDAWKQCIVPYHRRFEYPDSYTAASLNMYILDQTDKPTYKYEYSRVYPKTINSTELSYANGNTIAGLNIEFVFEDVYYESLTDTTVYPSKFKASKPQTVVEIKQNIKNREITESLNPQDRR